MTNHEMIKRLPLEELSKFLTSHGIAEKVGNDWCRNHCEHRLPDHGCNIDDDCVYQDEAAVIAWLKEQSKENDEINEKDDNKICFVNNGLEMTQEFLEKAEKEIRELERLAEIGKATIKALEYQPKSEEEEIIFNNIEELIEWAKEVNI